MITLTNVSKKFDSSTVVDDVSFKIRSGEIVGVLGPNGAGKTTTLRMVAGVLPPSHGQIEIDGLDLARDADRAKEKIGYLPENNPLFEDLTVEEYLKFWCQIKGLSLSESAEAITFVVESCGISEVYYRPMAELSKGYRQRVGLSQALLNKPEILILDEPTEGLDPNQRQDIAALIKSLGKKRTVIISSHVLSELAKISSRMIVIHKGRLVADDTPQKLKLRGTTSTIVYAEIKGAHVITTLKKNKDIQNVSEVGPHQYEITSAKNIDIREKIFKTAVKEKWILLGLSQKEADIERVFAQLTSG